MELCLAKRIFVLKKNSKEVVGMKRNLSYDSCSPKMHRLCLCTWRVIQVYSGVAHIASAAVHTFDCLWSVRGTKSQKVRWLWETKPLSPVWGGRHLLSALSWARQLCHVSWRSSRTRFHMVREHIKLVILSPPAFRTKSIKIWEI